MIQCRREYPVYSEQPIEPRKREYHESAYRQRIGEYVDSHRLYITDCIHHDQNQKNQQYYHTHYPRYHLRFLTSQHLQYQSAIQSQLYNNSAHHSRVFLDDVLNFSVRYHIQTTIIIQILSSFFKGGDAPNSSGRRI